MGELGKSKGSTAQMVEEKMTSGEWFFLVGISAVTLVGQCEGYPSSSVSDVLLMESFGVLPCQRYVAREHDCWPYSRLTGDVS